MESKKRRVEENGLSNISSDDVRTLIEPFAKDQLIEILQEAAVEHPDVLDEIRRLADQDPAHRKLFVRGLSWETTVEPVRSVFSQYGEIEDCQVVMDKSSGKSRGYGFVTFKHRDGAQRALKDPSKKIEGRMTVCQLASAGPTTQSQSSQDLADRKIYVGNVPPDLSAEKLLTAFSQYGEIEEGPLGFDKQTGKSKGFAIFIYKSVDSIKRALEEPVKRIDGHQLNCKLASEGLKQKGSSFGQLDAADLALAQAGIVGPSPNLPYGALSHSSLSGLLPLGQGILGQQSLNPALAAQGLLSSLTPSSSLASLNASLYPSVAHQLALNSSLGSSFNSPLSSSLNSSLPSALNSSLAQRGSQGLSQAFEQVPGSTGLTSYGLYGLGGYGSQVGGLGGSASLYGMSPSSTGSQAGFLQGSGHNSLAALQNSRMGKPSGGRSQPFSSYFTN